jgi:hypothetical protein
MVIFSRLLEGIKNEYLMGIGGYLGSLFGDYVNWTKKSSVAKTFILQYKA